MKDASAVMLRSEHYVDDPENQSENNEQEEPGDEFGVPHGLIHRMPRSVDGCPTRPKRYSTHTRKPDPSLLFR